MRTRKDLQTYTIYADYGIGVILKRNNQNILTNLNKKDFKKLKFKDFFYNYNNWMNIISYDKFKKIF